MRILYSDFDSFYPFNLAGSQQVGHLLLRHLAREDGVSCLALTPRRGRGIPGPEYHPKLVDLHPLGIRSVSVEEDRWTFDAGYPLVAVDKVADHLEAFLDEHRPDVFYCHNPEEGPALLRPALERGMGCVWFFHDTRAAPEDVRWAAENGVELVSCSRFMARQYHESTGAELGVIYPIARREDYRVDADLENGRVTVINAMPEKGIETVLGLLELVPELPLLLVESWPLGVERFRALEERLRRFPNAVLWSRQADVREVYRQTRLLLAPSVWPEPAGRVVLEAQMSGIPVLASGVGGLPEMVGKGGRVIEDYRDPAAWAAALREIEADPALYRQLSERALVNSQREDFDPPRVARYFLGLCRRAVARTSESAGKR